jgi:hypothetical protein
MNKGLLKEIFISNEEYIGKNTNRIVEREGIVFPALLKKVIIHYCCKYHYFFSCFSPPVKFLFNFISQYFLISPLIISTFSDNCLSTISKHQNLITEMSLECKSQYELDDSTQTGSINKIRRYFTSLLM